MLKRVLIIGGYGNFGSHIAKALSTQGNIQLIIAGRNIHKATHFSHNLNAINPAESNYIDIYHNLSEAFYTMKPDIVIHASGPYQDQPYDVAKACIEYKCHYIDLADARDFVVNIVSLDADAKKAGVLICSGASSVPCLTAAIIDKYIGEFKSLDSVHYAISTAHLTNRGLATTQAVLSYAGKAFGTKINGENTDLYGWLGITLKKFPNMGYRFLGNGNVPDLELFPKRYPNLKTICFKAGLEFKFMQIILGFLSWLVKIGLIQSLKPYAQMMLKAAFLFDWLGKSDSGFYMDLTGKDHANKNKKIHIDIIARNGDGLYIPCIPAIIMAKKLSNHDITDIGAKPCLDFISLDAYLAEMKGLNIEYSNDDFLPRS